MTDNEFEAAISRSGLQLRPETMAELRRASANIESLIARVTRDKPVEAEPAVVFYPEQRT
ncbi:MAG TPA: hypothetical protein VKR55_18710 [Bradyrhizobium sp.]|uniref:hypothetical protein n=1 Tax=Bradyrhizobium sp. TaxID=376 RepID=UPI002C727C6B|nr:hypothetical protein [Bradyrhizobium sp.]HLZ04164.1 hypothetical protein [Bradyrhizobium sp.]